MSSARRKCSAWAGRARAYCCQAAWFRLARSRRSIYVERRGELAASLNAKTVDHLEQTTTESIAVMKKAGVQPVLLPGSVYAIGSQKYAPARAMIEAGLPVVIATDFNPGSSPTTSMPMILSLACTQMKMTPAEAVTAATVNAAWSLDGGHDIGSLEPGKLADFVVHDAEDYRELAYLVGGHRPHAVFVAGTKV